jgi:fumarate hydratase subunit alpha
MRKIPVKQIRDAVSRLCGKTNLEATPVLVKLFRRKMREEKSEPARDIFRTMLKNIEAAREEKLPLCQDTGMAVVFLEVGQEVHFTEGDLNQAVNEGVRRGYAEYFLRKSVVDDPLLRRNTGDNTPAVIHSRIVPGERVKVTVVPKGFGSENMSRLAMLKPGEGREGVKRFVVETVRKYGAAACPPLVVGVGIGGTFEKAALLAKEALTLPLGRRNRKKDLRRLEEEILAEIDSLKIGPQGLGGECTVLAVHVLAYPTHIAGLPVAVNLSCHLYRHGSKVI